MTMIGMKTMMMGTMSNRSPLNLLEYVRHVLIKNGKSEDEIQWVGVSGKYSMTWLTFVENAKVQTFDPGYGSDDPLPMGLVIMAKDWWLEVAEYDGSTSLVLKTIPTRVGGKVLTGKIDLLLL